MSQNQKKQEPIHILRNIIILSHLFQRAIIVLLAKSERRNLGPRGKVVRLSYFYLILKHRF